MCPRREHFGGAGIPTVSAVVRLDFLSLGADQRTDWRAPPATMIPILQLTDANLGQEAFATLSRANGPIHWHFWRRGDLEGARKLQARIEERQWDCCLSC
jgi:hypothetical protein